MAFVNEFVSPEDFDKYGFREINRKYRMIDEETNWTVDKERDIYIRKISWGHASPGFVRFHMYWKGQLFFAYIIYGENHSRKLKGIDIPKDLESEREEIIECLREAIRKHGDGGAWSIDTSFEGNVQF